MSALRLALPALALLASAAVANPDTPTVVQVPAGTAPKVEARDRLYASNEALDANLNEVVCKRQETTGTRLGTRRVCKTRAEWNAEAENAKAQMRRLDDLNAASGRSQ